MRRLDGIAIGISIAISRGGRLISTEYINSKCKMEWECSIGHRWNSALVNIKNKGRWCPKCGKISSAKLNMLKDGLLIANRISASRRGRCLSSKYIGVDYKMKWSCEFGHIWEAKLKDVKGKSSWCPECFGNKIDGIVLANEIAIKKGGSCISNLYINNHTHLKWECSSGHVWNASLHNVKDNNTWCPKCSTLQSARNQNNSCTLQHWKTGEELACTASYEKKVVEYLNVNRINFRWQPKTFTTNILTKTGKLSTYRPDLYLFSTKKWIEIKGYMRDDAKEKWDWFRSVKPNSELWDEKKLKSMGIL